MPRANPYLFTAVPWFICLQLCPCIFVCNGALAYLFTSTHRSQHGMLSLLQMEYMQPTRRPADRVTERSLDGQSADSPIGRFNGRPAVRPFGQCQTTPGRRTLIHCLFQPSLVMFSTDLIEFVPARPGQRRTDEVCAVLLDNHSIR